MVSEVKGCDHHFQLVNREPMKLRYKTVKRKGKYDQDYYRRVVTIFCTRCAIVKQIELGRDS